MSTATTDRSVTAPPKPAHGLSPPVLDDSVHFVRCLAQLRSKDQSIEKYIYLSQLKDADPNMFYKICMTHMSVRDKDRAILALADLKVQEITPLIYTPTVGDACLQYSHIYRRPEGLVRCSRSDFLLIRLTPYVLVYLYQG